MRYHLSRAGISASVESRGLMPPGRPMPEPAQAAMARRGINVTGYTSMLLEPDDVRSARLLLGMERRHVREAVVYDRDALGRSFTIRDFVRRAHAEGPRGDRPFSEWLAAVGEGRSPADLMGDGRPDEVPDPMGASPEVFEAVTRELEDLIVKIVWLVLGGARPQGPPVEPVSPEIFAPPPPRLGGGIRRWINGPHGPGRYPSK